METPPTRELIWSEFGFYELAAFAASVAFPSASVPAWFLSFLAEFCRLNSFFCLKPVSFENSELMALVLFWGTGNG